MKTRCWLVPCSLGLCFLLTNLAPAAHKEPPIHFDHISIHDGLSNPAVYRVIQDRHGFLWMATSDGLNRYDGYEFKIFRNIPEDPYSLGENRMLTVFEDSHGIIWLGLEGKGLDRFDPDMNRFQHIRRDPDDPNGLPNNYVQVIVQDKVDPDYLWIGTRNGLTRLHMTSGAMVNYFDNGEAASLSDNHIKSLYVDHSNNLWVGTLEGGLSRYDRENDGFINYMPDPGTANGVDGSAILAIHEEPDGVLWLGTETGLLRLDTRGNSFQGFSHNPADHHSMQPFKISSIVGDGEGKLWVATFGGGLSQFDPLTGKATNYVNDPIAPNSLPQNRIRCLLVDRSDILWIGTSAEGLAYCHRAGTQFFTYSNHPLKPQSLSGKEVNVIIEDSREDVWVGTTNGLNQLLGREGNFKRYFHDPKDPRSLTSSAVYSMYEDRSGQIWAGTPMGLNRFVRERDHFVRYNHNPHNPHSLSSDDIWAISEDAEGYLWVGTWNNGLNRYNPKTGRFQWYLHDPSDANSLSHSCVIDLHEDRFGTLWIATFGGGLNSLDRERANFQVFRRNSEDPNSLCHDSVQVIHEDSHGDLWLGTGGGLSHFLKRKQSFRNYYMKDGLPSNTINGILEDDRGFLWLATNYGLSRFDPVSETFRNLTSRDGLQSNLFDMAYCKSANGDLMFGGKNGFNIFDPQKILPNNTPPQAVFTDFRIFNQSAALRSKDPESPLIVPIENTTELTLSYLHYAFSLQFAALHFDDPKRNIYQYKLEPFDKDWISTTAENRLATYSNLNSGDYLFHLKVANKDGVWNKETRRLAIHIQPKPWRTWWAYATYGLLLFLGYLAIEVVRLRRKRKLEEKNAELAITNSELHTLDDIVRVINHEISLNTILKVLLDQGLRLFKGADRGGFLLWDEVQKNFRIAATTGYNSEDFENIKSLTFTRQELISRYTEDSLEIGEGIYLVRNENNRPGSRKLISNPKSMIAMAVIINDKVQGFVVWDNYSDPNAFKPEDAHRLDRFREHAISAITKAHMLHELKTKNKEIMQTRDQLVVQEKMASLGTLTAGIAHEIRNPLNFINNFAMVIIDRFEELLEELNKNREELDDAYFESLKAAFKELQEDAAIIVNHGEKAGHIVKSMIEIATAQKGEQQETNINTLVDEFSNLAYHTIQDKNKDFHINISKHFDSTIEPYVCASYNLSRALANLVTNGLEAIIERIQLGETPFEPMLLISTHDLEHGLEIRIEDNGTGIADHHKDRIFNPFYTTKPPQGHVGLGLWISYDIIVHEHQGELELKSENGRTLCTIRLPKTDNSYSPWSETLENTTNAQ